MSDSPHYASQTLRRLLSLGLGLGLAMLLLAGCTLLAPPRPDPLAAYRPALSPAFSLPPVQMNAIPVYSITVRIDPPAQAYTGSLDLTLPVSNTPISQLYFRLFPNLRQLDGSLEVSNARLDGISVNYAYTTSHSAVHLSLPAPVVPGKIALIHLDFTGKFSRHSDEAYTLFGISEDVLSLANFYPILAPRRESQWVLDIPDPQGDIGFFDSAFYQVTVVAPVGQVLVSSGSATGARMAGPGLVTYHYVQGPGREFMLLLSPRWQVEEVNTYGTHVRSYFFPEDADAGRTALFDAASALQVYSDHFGPYPYREMSVVESPITFRGQEFPGLNLIGSQAYSTFLKDLENRVAHEVGHQWWYNQVGSDQIDAPWQDEGLTEFSTYFYYADRYGPPVGDSLRRSRWVTPVGLVAGTPRDMPIGRSVPEYNQGNYETMIYAKGALFFATLRDEMGPDAFDRFLRAYLQRYRWQIARPEDLQALASEVSGRDLTALFNQWLNGIQ